MVILCNEVAPYILDNLPWGIDHIKTVNSVLSVCIERARWCIDIHSAFLLTHWGLLRVHKSDACVIQRMLVKQAVANQQSSW